MESPPPRDEEPTTSRDRLEIDVPFSELDFALRHAFLGDRPETCAAGAPVTLIATRRRFGWTLSARARLETWKGDPLIHERVLHHEVVGRHGGTTLVEDRGRSVGHACEQDPAYRWLVEPREGDAGVWCVSGTVPTASHRARRILERFRLRALDTADVLTHRSDVADLTPADLPVALHDAVREALFVARGGYLVERMTACPILVCALGIVLGDAPDGWVRGDDLTTPLQLAAAGLPDREVLAAAFEYARGRPATDAMVERLWAMATAIERPCAGAPGNPWAYLREAIDVDCEVARLTEMGGGIGNWARVQCWASRRQLPEAARTYLSRFGDEIPEYVGRADAAVSPLEVLESALRIDAEAYLRDRVPPAAILRRVSHGTFVGSAEIEDWAAIAGVTVRRITTARELRRLGGRFREHLRSLDESLRVFTRRGATQHFLCESADGLALALAEVERRPDTWHLVDLIGTGDEWMASRTRWQIEAALQRAVPGLVTEDDE